MAIDDPTKQSIARALGRVPSGLFILAAEHEKQAAAILVSWVQQASFDPPAISIALAKERHIVPLINRSGRLTVSILAKTDSNLMKRYVRGIPPTQDPFLGVNIARTPAGLPCLADALAWLECKVLTVCDFAADHELYLAQITAASLLKDDPSFTHTRGNGFHY